MRIFRRWSCCTALAHTLERKGRKDEAAIVDTRFRKIWAEADIRINLSRLRPPVT